MKTIPPGEGRRFNPLNDFLFFKVMGEKGDEAQLLGFLNAVLGRTGKNRFTSVEILENKSFIAEAIGGKSSNLDVRAVLQGGSRINVEVQLRNQYNMDKRSLFYWSRMFIRSLKTGQDYRELPRVITINILNYEFLPAGDFHTCFHLKEDRDNTLLTDALEIHYVDMVKWRRLGGKDIVNNSLHRWLTWFDPGSAPELVAEVVSMDTAIQKADKRQDHVLSDDDALRIYEMRQKAHWDLISTTNYAREEGHKEGHKEGHEEGHKEGLREGSKKGREDVARKALAEGATIEFVRKITGLSAREIAKLNKKR